ncbi:MAG: DUF362 domain-containing protein [bacterium]|jgi:uncharacterized protein (DUF362 family)|nr:DUF362 domain-containing protein [candidate division KSB1 bacterium]MDH7559915.1 DUF362 domain-containing protein [bacterium]
MARRATVAVVRTSPERVQEDIARAMELAGFRQHLAPGVTTILKDNISWHYPFPSANTTPWQLEGVVRTLREAGYRDLVAVHNNTVVTNPRKGAKLNRLAPVYERHQVAERYNFLPQDMAWVPYRPKSKMLVLDKVFPEGIRLPDFFFGKNIVHLPTLKCHIYTTTTGAMKNAFGGLLNTRRHYTHSVIHETLVDLLAIQREIHPGIFAAMDGTTAGDGPGPRTMRPVQADLILASGDQVAVDAVAAKILGFAPMQVGYIRLAHEAGLGVGRPEEIELVGDDVEGFCLGCKVGDNLASRAGDLFWFGGGKRLQKLLFRTPLVYLFVFASAAYHDLFWWPVKGRTTFDRWRQQTPWGRLFDSYAQDLQSVRE